MKPHKKNFTTVFHAVTAFIPPKKTDVEKLRRRYKKLAALTHPDVDGCKYYFKTIHQAYAILIDEKIKAVLVQWGLEKTKDEL